MSYIVFLMSFTAIFPSIGYASCNVYNCEIINSYEENTKEIMSAKEFIYLIQNQVQFSHQISFVYFKLLKNTNVLMKTFHKSFTFASVLYRIYKLSPSALVCISDKIRSLMLYTNALMVTNYCDSLVTHLFRYHSKAFRIIGGGGGGYGVCLCPLAVSTVHQCLIYIIPFRYRLFRRTKTRTRG